MKKKAATFFLLFFIIKMVINEPRNVVGEDKNGNWKDRASQFQ